MSRARNQRRLAERRAGAQRAKDQLIVRSSVAHYAEHGCARCGGHGSMSTAVVMPDGSPICVPCLQPGERQIGIGTIHGVKPVSDGQEDDRVWFQQNPGEEWRLREPHHMEIEELVARNEHINLMMGSEVDHEGFRYCERTAKMVFTLQVEQGVRVRIPCTPPAEAEDVAAWVNDVALPAVRAQARRSMAANLEITPGHRALALNAASIRRMPNAAVFTSEAKAQGQAMREARGATRQ